MRVDESMHNLLRKLVAQPSAAVPVCPVSCCCVGRVCEQIGREKRRDKSTQEVRGIDSHAASAITRKGVSKMEVSTGGA